MRKKWLALTSFIVAVMLFFTGCSLPESIHNSLQEWVDSENARIESDSDYMTADKYAKIMMNQVLECFLNKDKETLTSLFSEYVQTNYANILDTNIDLAFDFLDGKIETYDEPFGSAYGAHTRKYYDGDVCEIITDKGTEYKLYIAGLYRCDEEPERVGLYGVTIRNETLLRELDDSGVDTSEDQSWHIIIG